jgi:predicted phosphate transport protein (TIGR00153 family)
MTIIDRLFRKSPFKPLMEHAKKVLECVELINPVIEAWFDENWDEIEILSKKMAQKENEADETKKNIREGLPKSLFYPVPRGDLMRILKNQDDIADTAEDFCIILTLRKTNLPSELKADFRKFVDKILDVCQIVLEATEELDVLMEASFTGPEAKKILKVADTAGQMEYEADKMSQSLVQKLLKMEQKLDPLTIIFCMKIFEALGELANYAENSGDNLRHLIICRT